MNEAHNNNILESLRSRIPYIQTYDGSVKLLNLINQELISNPASQELKSMRQKVYDTRRKLKLVPDQTIPSLQTGLKEEQTKLQITTDSLSYANIFNIATFGFVALASGSLISIQSLEIYKRMNFDYPVLATAGALLLMASSAVIRVLKPTTLTLCLCLYVLSYESYFMVSGSLKAESSIRQESVQSDPKVQMLKMQSEDAKASYEKALATYNQNQNSWYKVKFLDPSKEKYIQSLASLSEVTNKSEDFSILKIMYRLGLILLFTISVGFLFKWSKK